MVAAKTRRILVPIAGASIDEASLRVACDQAKRDHSEVTLLYVIEVRLLLPIDVELPTDLARGEKVLEELERQSKPLGCRVQTYLLQAREAGPAIVSEAIANQVDLIVLGVPYREKFGSFTVEPRALYVLEHAPCRVLLLREPLRNPSPH